MYALPNKTQHKLIVKVRGGISQKLDNISSNSTSSGSQGSNSSKSSSSSFSLASASNSAFGIAGSPTRKDSSLNRHVDETGFNAELSHLPQPVFHSINQNGNKQKSSYNRAQKQQFITPEHNEMIKYVQQSWKGVERDYKNSVENFISNIDINSSQVHTASTTPSTHLKQKQVSAAKKKTATTPSPLLLSGSYHHTSSAGAKGSGTGRQDSFRPFDLETFWGNRILQRLTGDM